MDIRELPKILIKEFCVDAEQKSTRDIQKNRSEIWQGSLAEGIGVTVFDNLAVKGKYLKIWREKDCGRQDGIMRRPSFFEMYVGPEFLYHHQEKGNIYRDKVFMSWPLNRTNLKDETCITIICRMIMRAQELIESGAFEFPTFAVSSEYPDGVRIPI